MVARPQWLRASGTWIAVFLVVVLLAPGAVTSSGHTETKPYVGSSPVTPLDCDGHYLEALRRDLQALGVNVPDDVFDPVNDEYPGNIGGACFDTPAGASYVDVEIEDVSGLPVTGWLSFWHDDNTILDTTFFCSTILAAVPPGTTLIRVTTQTLAIGCLSPPPEPSSVPVTGEVHVEWS